MLGISARRSIEETEGKQRGIHMSSGRRWQTAPAARPCILQLAKGERKGCSDSSYSEREQRGEAEGKARGKLVALFGEEREFAGSAPMVVVQPPSPRRAKERSKVLEAERSKVVEALRAECNVLRMEKEAAVRRWEEASRQTQHALTMAHSLHSALQTLVTVLLFALPLSFSFFFSFFASTLSLLKHQGRRKIVDDKNAQLVLQTTLQNQIQALQSKLHTKSEFSIRQTQPNNFDRQALYLRRRLLKSRSTSQCSQHRLENLVLAAQYSTESDREEEENPELGIREGKDDEIETRGCSPSFLGDQPNQLGDANLLKKRLDSLSMGMKESEVAAAQIREDYKHMLSRSRDCSSRRWDAPERAQGGSEEELCCQLCKATIRKIAAQVQAETEQWSQVQEVLHHVCDEMEELHKSRDFWEDRALKADAKSATLRAEMHEWRAKAHTYSNNVSELQSEISRLRNEIERVRQRHALEQSRWLCQADSDSEDNHMRRRASKFMPAEKRVQLKENLAPQKRPKSPLPLVDIGNTNANASA